MRMNFTLIDSNNEAHKGYEHEVVSVCFYKGKLILVCKDKNDEVFTLSYTSDSMGADVLTILDK